MQQTKIVNPALGVMSSTEVNKADKLLTWLGEQALDVINLRPLQEALTHTSAGRSINHEELEFLGDAVLRLAATQ